MDSQSKKFLIFCGAVCCIAVVLIAVTLRPVKENDGQEDQPQEQQHRHSDIKCVEEIEVATPNLEGNKVEFSCNTSQDGDCVKMRSDSDLCLTCTQAMAITNRTYKNDKCCEILSLCKATESDYCQNGGYLHCHSNKARTRKKKLICKCPKGWKGKDCSQPADTKLIVCKCYKLVINPSPYCKETTFNATHDKECIAKRESGVEQYCVCDNRHAKKITELGNIERCKKIE